MNEKPRIRAAKACKRCSQRKIKCDAVQNGLPCSRCRMDRVAGCALISSRRGTYDRKPARLPRPVNETSPMKQIQKSLPTNEITNLEAEAPAVTTPSSTQESDPRSGTFSPDSAPAEHSSTHNSVDLIPPPTSDEPKLPPRPESVLAATPTDSTSRSVSAMFEDFISWRTERNMPQCGLVLLGEASPLTFALEEYPQETSPPLHDASDQIRDSANLAVIQQDIHPSHLDAADIAYLKAKGAFIIPLKALLNNLASAYLTRFHSLYSIVNKLELEKVHNEQKTPWLLLHAVCFIGATFCDSAVIHQSNFRSRLDARRHYYQKAKLFFDFGYEKNKIILAQCAIMLSFWGPETHSHWNPCSWIGFGVTFAISLGIHRSVVSSDAPRGDKGLLRRLWWTLVVRDTYCSVLLGRPFRINLTQSDTELLKAQDFIHENTEDGFYQIQIGRLSLLLRQILHCRFGPSNPSLTPAKIHADIEQWHSDLHRSLQDWHGRGAPIVYSIALELLYNYYLLLLYIETPTPLQPGNFPPQSPEQPLGGIVESSARTISSHAITLMTKTNLCDLPHELFPALFVAGIVHYRQTKHQNELVSHMARANLDNCRVVLNYVKGIWDPANWAMEIFDFLCTNQREMITGPAQMSRAPYENCRSIPNRQSDTSTPHVASENREFSGDSNHDASFDLSWDVIQAQFTGGMEDFLLMPNFLPPATDEWAGYQL
ncbi:hypothetical protein PENSOL_c097G05189 [Penicillium solitum]|uniref:Zn(2)-C6 fungal-type domain-containing protein n=1 Tax=Penicillium solitum TaxID=60172 RepID=A0A1V6Q9B8_9EURO|nr:uncharacterized protein PENSOL_c097G05189 [Penicillium solitum]OQD85587.1 hypothetical protein PENSOL_c097G05189 [Penicillium solitum]